MSELASDFEFSRPVEPVFDVLPLCEPLAPWIAPLVLLDFPLDVSIVFFTFPVRPHSWTMTCYVCSCQTIACLCSCVHRSLVENALHHRTKKHPSRGLDDPFPWPDKRELTASTSMGAECPREAVSLGLESRTLKPNFASKHVTISRRASSKVHKRFELRIRCFSSSSGTSASRPASLISSSNLSFSFFS